jgi:hypothetical protein
MAFRRPARLWEPRLCHGRIDLNRALFYFWLRHCLNQRAATCSALDIRNALIGISPMSQALPTHAFQSVGLSTLAAQSARSAHAAKTFGERRT